MKTAAELHAIFFAQPTPAKGLRAVYEAGIADERTALLDDVEDAADTLEALEWTG